MKDLFLLPARNADYSVPGPLEVTFMDGSTFNGSTSCATITIIDDFVLEGDHFFTVGITSTNVDVTTAMPSSSAVNILDNESMYMYSLYSMFKCMYL